VTDGAGAAFAAREQIAKWKSEAAARRAAGTTLRAENAAAATARAEAAAGSVETVALVPSSPAPAPVDADTAFRRIRLGLVAVLALTLLLVWFAQRRARTAQREDGR